VRLPLIAVRADRVAGVAQVDDLAAEVRAHGTEQTAGPARRVPEQGDRGDVVGGLGR
jgi:hypothetical protein